MVVVSVKTQGHWSRTRRRKLIKLLSCFGYIQITGRLMKIGWLFCFIIYVWLGREIGVSFWVGLMLLRVEVIPVRVVLANNSFYLHACEILQFVHSLFCTC